MQISLLLCLAWPPLGIGAEGTDDRKLNDVQAQLAATVENFNEHALSFNVSEPETIAAFNAFIEKEIAPRWRAGLMAEELLGAEDFQALPVADQQAVKKALTLTFYRYTYEILEEYRHGPMALVGDLRPAENGWQRIKLKAKPRILPALTGDMYVVLDANGWAIVDAGMAAFTYISLKRKGYRRQYEKGGVEGLVAWLEKKNVRYFEDYCEAPLQAVMPASLGALCANDAVSQG